MKNISVELIDFLQDHGGTSYQNAGDNVRFSRYDLIAITLANSQVVRATTGPIVQYGGNWFYPTKYGTWERGAITYEAGYQPTSNSMTLTVSTAPAGSENSNTPIVYPGTNTSLLQTVAAGLFDAAQVQVWTYYQPAGVTPAAAISALGVVYMFLGQITKVNSSGRSKVEFEVSDMLFQLNLQFPTNLVTTSCFWQLFDARCTLSRAAYASASSVAIGSNQIFIRCASNPTATVNGYVFSGDPASSTGSLPDYQQGYLTFTSGQNSGLSYYIKQDSASGGVVTLQLARATALPIATGDTFNAFPGCNKSQARCQQFVNIAHYGGYSFVPNPEYAV